MLIQTLQSLTSRVTEVKVTELKVIGQAIRNITEVGEPGMSYLIQRLARLASNGRDLGLFQITFDLKNSLICPI